MTAVKEQNISSQIPQIEHLNLKVKSQVNRNINIGWIRSVF
jgi:hypothetical protein